MLAGVYSLKDLLCTYTATDFVADGEQKDPEEHQVEPTPRQCRCCLARKQAEARLQTG